VLPRSRQWIVGDDVRGAAGARVLLREWLSSLSVLICPNGFASIN